MEAKNKYVALFRDKKTINLTQKNIDDENAGKIANALKYNQILTHINLSQNCIGVEGISVIAKVLETNNTITNFDISTNNIGAEGVGKIEEVIKVNKTLVQIDLCSNNILAEGTSKLVEVLKINQNLTRIDFSRNSIGDEGAANISEVIKFNKTLKQIGLRYNNISVIGATKIAEALLINNILEQLDLSWNNIFEKGAKNIAKSLNLNRSLTNIDLSWNNIGRGSTHIANSLKLNNTLKIIDLSRNSINDRESTAIGEGLKNNLTLTHLNLSWNNITTLGITKLSEVLCTNSKLTHLDLSKNKIGTEGVIILKESLKINKTIIHIDLCDNEIDKNTEEEITILLKENNVAIRDENKKCEIPNGENKMIVYNEYNCTPKSENLKSKSVIEKDNKDKVIKTEESKNEKRKLHLDDVNHYISPDCDSTITPTNRKLDNLLIRRSNFKISTNDLNYVKDKRNNRKILGSGGFGMVFLGTFGRTKVAIKEIEFRKNNDGKEGVMSEIDLMLQVRHPNVCNIIGFDDDDEEIISLVTEFYECGDLSSILLDKNIKLDEEKKLSFLLDIAEGMKHLHSKSIMHRDLKCKNIYVSANMEKCVVGDFGLSKPNSRSTKVSAKGTLDWIAPELLQVKKASLAVDVYSFAIVMYEILSRSQPYDDLSDYLIYQKIISGERPDISKIEQTENNKHLIKLMQECWNGNPQERPKFSEIITRLNVTNLP